MLSAVGVHVFDALTGKELGEGKPLVHKTEVVGVALSQCGAPTDRLLALLDKNNDLYITTVRGPLANTTQALGKRPPRNMFIRTFHIIQNKMMWIYMFVYAQVQW